jgi:hypothetical protein
MTGSPPPTKARYTYSAYGLNLRSDVSLPELVESEMLPDVDVSFHDLGDNYLNTLLSDAVQFERPGCLVRVSKNAVCYSWHDIGTALVRNGNEVIISTAPGTSDSDLAPFITGALLGNLLEQRGFMVLHGSAVAVDGAAAAFLGEKGAGKSTLALHLQKRGYPLLTDDLLPVVFDDNQVRTVPGFPRIKVWSDTVRSMGFDPDTLPKINKFIDKRSYVCADGFLSDSVNVGRIYILTDDPKIAIEQIDPSKAFIELTRNTYLSRYLDATGKTADHFRKCETLVTSVPIFRLRRPRDFACLPEVTSAVVEHQL